MNKFEIEPDIIISKLDIKDGDTILMIIDTDKWDVTRAAEMLHTYEEIFPNNNIVITFKGIEIKGIKNEEYNNY